LILIWKAKFVFFNSKDFEGKIFNGVDF